MYTPADISAKLRSFIVSTFPAGKDRLADDTTSLLASGVVDSLGVLEIVSFIESEFEVAITEDEMLAENFESISTLAALVCGALEKKVTHGLSDSSLAAK